MFLDIRRLLYAFMLSSLVLTAACDKKKEGPEGPTRTEIYDKHHEQGKAQIENLRAVVNQASMLPVPSVEELSALPSLMPVQDIVINDHDKHDGNARLIRLDEIMTKGSDVELLDLNTAYKRIKRHIYPNGFAPGSNNWFIIRPAELLLNEPAGEAKDKEVDKERLALVEELMQLKYLLIMRTVILMKADYQGDNQYTQGGYAAEVMIFDLAKQELLARVPIVVMNEVGSTTTGPDFDLGYEAEQQLQAMIDAAK